MFVEAVAITTGKIIQLQLTDSVSDLSCLFWVDGMFLGPGPGGLMTALRPLVIILPSNGYNCSLTDGAFTPSQSGF
jgi:hypothetical protein